MLGKWPDNNLLKVDDKGVITFTARQWRYLLKITNCRAKTLAGQRKTIRKFVTDAVKASLGKGN